MVVCFPLSLVTDVSELGSLIEPGTHRWLDCGQKAQGIHLFPHLQPYGDTHVPQRLPFYTGAVDLNPGLHVCTGALKLLNNLSSPPAPAVGTLY